MRNLPLGEGEGPSWDHSGRAGLGPRLAFSVHSSPKRQILSPPRCSVPLGPAVILGRHGADSSPSQSLRLISQPPRTQQVPPGHSDTGTFLAPALGQTMTANSHCTAAPQPCEVVRVVIWIYGETILHPEMSSNLPRVTQLCLAPDACS